jgi:hypothetical protein
MTREQAMERATARFGDRACVGFGRPIASWAIPDTYYVGWKDVGEWRWLGMGASWDEAFVNVKRVKAFMRDKIEFFQEVEK